VIAVFDDSVLTVMVVLRCVAWAMYGYAAPAKSESGLHNVPAAGCARAAGQARKSTAG
jgi:hypothetical protein